MKRIKTLACSLLAVAIAVVVQAQASAVTVTVGDSSAPWNGFMNVSNLPSAGGAFQFPSSWGVADLAATFNDGANELALTPNTIGDVNEYWYQNTTGMAADPTNPGGPGQAGNKIMEANLFVQVDGTFGGDTVTFKGDVLADTTTAAHSGLIFIRDFAPDFTSFTETTIPLAPGAFSISHVTAANDPVSGDRHVQYGFQMVGENVWVTDVAPFGGFRIGTVPEPASFALFGLGMCALAAQRRRS